jgi:hypothetical protein
VVPGDQGRAGSRHVIVGFFAADGREYRIDDSSGRPRVRGDFVPVRYLPARPQDAVAADAGQGSSVGVVLMLAFLAVFALVGLFFAAIGFGVAGLGFAGGA